nr:uncharacterized protein LOC109182473 [Ipomoea batatas]
MVKRICCFQNIIVLSGLLLAVLVCSKDHGNSANDLVEIINKNRTAQKLPELGSSPGLGCIALQYAKECLENCSASNTVTCRPSEDDFTEIFAPNCGVELPTFGTISGRIVGCQKDYLDPSEAFSHVLVHDRATLSLLRNRTHTEVGVGIIKAHKHKGPYFWCVLFSSGKRNSTFVLDDLGEGIEQKTGCYSGTNTPCSSAHKHESPGASKRHRTGRERKGGDSIDVVSEPTPSAAGYVWRQTVPRRLRYRSSDGFLVSAFRASSAMDRLDRHLVTVVYDILERRANGVRPPAVADDRTGVSATATNTADLNPETAAIRIGISCAAAVRD